MTQDQPWRGRRLHFVGIGGAGMSGLALVAARLGARVSGSDRADSTALAALRQAGAVVAVGHDAAHVAPDAELVFSTAVEPQNAERAIARERGQREHHRGELLGELTRLKPTIAVTGTHGKTTTSAMAVTALQGAGLEPSFLLGGQLAGRNALWRDEGWLVVEADESDRSLLHLHPQVAVLTNAELDHHATYGSRLELEATFREFLARAPEAVVWDRPELLALRDGPVVAFDVPAPELGPGGSRFDWRGVEVDLRVPGAHNACNAAAALEACRLAGADPAEAAAGLRSFTGTGRRFEALGPGPAGAALVDDYAHHPTEVAATLQAARTLGPERLVAVFQPHLYSRTQRLAGAFGAALAQADLVVVLDVYPARERPEDFPGVDGRAVAAATADAAGGRTVAWLPGFDEAEGYLRETLRAGDLVLVLGAGDVRALGERLREPEPAPVAA